MLGKVRIPSNGIKYVLKVEFQYNDSPNRSTGINQFQILYGMHARGIYELKNLGNQELMSVNGEDFAASTLELQERFKQQLQENNNKYK